MHAHFRARLGNLVRSRQLSRAGHEAPATDQRRDRDVESSFGFTAESLSAFQQMKNVRRDTDWFPRRARVYPRNGAGWFEEAKIGFETFDFLQSRLRGGTKRHGGLAMQHDFEPGCHCISSHSDG